MSQHVTVVTGGAGNIGRAVAHRLGGFGHHVALLDLPGDHLDAAVEQLRSAGRDVSGFGFDATSPRDIADTLAAVSTTIAPVDVLVTSAGGSARAQATNVVDQNLNVLNRVLEVNLRSVYLAAQSVLPSMIRNRWGRVINIASILALQGKPRHAEYGAAKAGVISFTRSLAIEVGPHGITANCVSPGLIPRDPTGVEPNTNFVGRVGTAEDVAYAVGFLAADEADFITGHNLVVDGGRSLGLRGD